MFESDFEEIEDRVGEREGNYKGISSQALLTCEEDYRRIFSALPDIRYWIELGSGHGLGPLLFSYLHPEARSLGIEFEKARYEAGLRLKEKYTLKNVDFIHGDLGSCEIPVGDTYFLYFPTGPVLDRILFELGNRKDSFRLVCIESHGDFFSRLSKEKWLKVIKEIPLLAQRHHPHAFVYEKVGMKESSLHDVSFQEKYLLLKDQSGTWVGESLGLEWLKEDLYQLQVPPRSFEAKDVLSIVNKGHIEQHFHPALELRHLSSLRLETSSRIYTGAIRKIYVEPSFKLEISTGEQVEWEEIRQIFWESSLCYDSSSGYYLFPHAV